MNALARSLRVRRLGGAAVAVTGLVLAHLVGCGSDASVGGFQAPPSDLDGADAGNGGTTKPDAGKPDAGKPEPAATYAIGGTITGLAGSGLVIQNNKGDDVTIKANGTFTFPTKLEKGDAFAVTVKTQPSAPKQTCAVTGGSGTVASGNVNSIAINCATDTFTVGGSVSGLAGSGLVLKNGTATVSVNANGTFAFPATADGSDYEVTVDTLPTGPSQDCVVTSGKGKLASANVTNIEVACTTKKFTVGGTVAGLKGTGLVLRNNAGDDLSIAADGAFAFATALDDGSDFAVTVQAQPSGPTQTCSVAGGTGKLAGGNMTAITVTCATDAFAVGGTVSGLDGTGLVLQNNAGDNLTVNANGSFAFPTAVASGANYAVTVKTQPTNKWQTCSVTNGSGSVVNAAISNVSVACTTNKYKVGGTLSGLADGTSVVLQNAAGDDLTLSANGAFAFATSMASGATYTATVLTQPSGPSQTCTVTNGTGNVAGTDVSAIQIACATNQYTIGGTATGVLGAGLVLQNNAGNDLAVNGDGIFTFSSKVDSGGNFDVTVLTQPSAPSQNCVITGGSGAVTNGNIESVALNCTTNKFTVSGTVTGLDGVGLVLQNNAGQDLAITGTSFSFPAQDDLSAYAVTVKTNPTAKSQTCSVTNGTGNLAGANVGNVGISCTTNTYTIGGTVSGLAPGDSITLKNNGANDLALNANGSFTFTTPIASGSPYAVTVSAHPLPKVCTVTSGSGSVTGANITNVAVACAIPQSCKAIKQAAPSSASGTFAIDPDGAGPKAALSVYCDMTTDGGGYTSYAVTGGIPTNRYNQANSCQDLGLQMVVPRTAAHAYALYQKYGQTYFQTVPGVYGTQAGNYTTCAMNSSDATCSAKWKAIDGGAWFLKPAAYSEPNGDYTPGCWLGTDGYAVNASGFIRFNDGNCGYSTGPNYICSDNAK